MQGGAAAAAGAGAPPGGDHVLAAFPRIMRDEDLSDAFFSLWAGATRPLLAPIAGECLCLLHGGTGGMGVPSARAPLAAAADLRTAFRQCVTLVWALMGAQV